MHPALYAIPALIGGTAFYFAPGIPGVSTLLQPQQAYAAIGLGAAAGALAAHFAGGHLLIGAALGAAGALAANYTVGTSVGKLALTG